MIIAPEHSRMARAYLKWSIDDMARAAGLSGNTVQRFENGKTVSPTTQSLLVSAIREQGVELLFEDVGAAGIWHPSMST